ncbi:hypothetical protein [Candidatus Parabeggiatoa sp. HSG14]|uniref:WD40 repeat domain-containing protein n=1 Tax=Candidatus Parabeggiatoa sp. HSG14 TaxID=3055593 RepID=UPI0025A6AF21|nr:hypothetical protein [Thiotrichales bacterium HSG14]
MKPVGKKRTAKFKKSQGDIQNAFFSHNKRFLVLFVGKEQVSSYYAGIQGDIAILWDLKTNQQKKTFSSEGYDVILSPDEHFIVLLPPAYDYGEDKEIFVWDTNAKKQHVKLKGGEGPVAFAPNGRFIATSCENSKTICLWDINTGVKLAKLAGHNSEIHDIKFSPDGNHILTAAGDSILGSGASPADTQALGYDNTARIWNINLNKKIRFLRITNFEDTFEFIDTTFAFSPNSQYVATLSKDGMAYLWDVETGEQLLMQDLGERFWRAGYFSIRFTPDNKSIFLEDTRMNVAWLWNIKNNKLSTFFSHGENEEEESADLFSLFLFTDEKILGISPNYQYVLIEKYDNTATKIAQVLEISTLEQVAVLEKYELNNEVSFSPLGQYVLSVSEVDFATEEHGEPFKQGIAKIWETKTGKLLSVLGEYKSGTTVSTFFSPDEKFVLIYSRTDMENYSLNIWKVKTGKRFASIESKNFDIEDFYDFRITFTHNGQYFITNSSSGIWDINTGKQLENTDHIPPGGIFGPKGKYLVTWETFPKNDATLWNASSGKQVAVLTGHTQSIYKIMFSLNGQHVITYSSDNTTRIWNVKTGQQATMLKGYNALLSPDGQHLITDSVDGIVRLYPVFPTTQDLIDYARKIVPHQLSAEQRKQLFLE